MPTPQEDFIKVTGAPVEGVATPEYMAQVQPAPGMPQLDEVPNTPVPAEAPQAAPAAPSAPAPAPVSGPQQYVSDPGRAANPFAVVANLPGGTSTTTSTTNLGQAGKDARAASDAAYKQQGAALDKQGAAAEERARAEAEKASGLVKVANEFAAREQLDAQRAVERNNKALADLSASQEDYRKSTDALSPNHFWQQQSTGQKIGIAISMALSGIGQVFMARAGNVNMRNGAVDMINAAIDRDIDMQKTALAAKERGVRMKESAYSAARQAGADDVQATSLAKASAYQKAMYEGDAKIAQTVSTDAKARWEQARGQLEQQRAAELQRVAEIQATRTQSTSSSTPITAAQLGMMQAQQAGLVPKDPKLATPYGQAPDQETRRTMIKEGARLKGIDNALNVVSQGSASAWASPGKRKALDAAWAQLTGWVKGEDVQNAGASLTDSEKALLLDPMISDADIMTRTETRNAAISALKKLHAAKLDAVKQYAVRTTL